MTDEEFKNIMETNLTGENLINYYKIEVEYWKRRCVRAHNHALYANICMMIMCIAIVIKALWF